jgi:dihydroxy-acid dehydratase
MRSDIIKDKKLLFTAMGRTKEEIEKPFIGIGNSQTELVAGHLHLGELAACVKEGVIAEGGTPFEFFTIALCDGLAMGHKGMTYPLASRELIADSVEAVIEAHQLDAMVLLCTCDKIIPGMLMAAARLDIPAIIMTGGPMQIDKGADRPTSLNWGDEWLAGCGGSPWMATSSTMACMAEVLGLALPWSSCIPAVYGKRRQLAKQAGRRIMELYKKQVIPRDILTKEAFENAITVDMTLSGSTNTILHLMAIANEVGVELDLNVFDEISRHTPRICNFAPGGSFVMEDLYEAGGLQAVMMELSKKELIHLDSPTVSGKTIGEVVQGSFSKQPDVIRDIENPYSLEGGIAILRGNLAPEGAVVKQAAVASEMMVHSGPAKVFDIEEDAVLAIKDGRIKPGDVLVVRYEGPKGGPGMREMLTATTAVTDAGLEKTTALITDGRFSGATRGPAVGHISPEAMEKGPIAIVQDGDVIEIDILKRKLTVQLTREEVSRRLSLWSPPPLKRNVKSYLRRYSAAVTSASTGAVLKWS